MSQRLSGNTQSQASVSINRDAVNECCRYVLFREGTKIPIKRADIANHLSNACETPKYEVAGVIAAADSQLKNVYGYTLVKDNSKGVLQYMVVLSEACEETQISTLIEKKEQMLLNVALAHIFMSGGLVKEENLWKFLNKARLMEEGDNTVRTLFMKKFTSQLYLTCTKRDGDSLLRTIFQWGPRAKQEVTKMFMLQKVSETLGKHPEFWSEQFTEANCEENTAPS